MPRQGAFLKEDRLISTPGTAEPLGVSPPEAVDLLLIKFCSPQRHRDHREKTLLLPRLTFLLTEQDFQHE
jgi:hypothetical protein